MKKQTKIAAALSAAAFMMMVSGLPVYAASYGWVTEGDMAVVAQLANKRQGQKATQRSTTMRTGTSPPMPGESVEKTGSISVKMDRS